MSNEFDIDALPRVVQKEIRSLRAQVERLEDQAKETQKMMGLHAADEDTGAWLDGEWMKPNIPLRKHAQVCFQVEDAVVTVGRGIHGDLEVRTVGSILISPVASNVVRVEVKR